MKFAPIVERWRSAVAALVPATLVDKVLWTINGESGGKPETIGDNGVSVGLLQIQNNTVYPSRPTTEQLLDPLFNLQYAVSQLGIGSGNFSAWGEGTHGKPNQFGALGNNPFPGDNGSLGPLPIPDPTGAINGVLSGIGGFFVDKTGSIVSSIPGADAISSVVDAGKASASFFFNAAKALGWLLDPHHWFRLFFLAAGTMLVLTGGYLYVRGDNAINDAATIGKAVAA